ncbi:MAG TPA: hypothetical protein VGN26_21775 [Armatimonadota bacterium]
MAVLRVLSAQGDTVYTWDERKAESGDPGALEAIREAEQIVREAQQRGAVAFSVKPGQPAERVDQFDRRAQEIVLVPRIIGG